MRAPNANARGERWVSSVRHECLDWLLIVGRRHLEGEQALRAERQAGEAYRRHVEPEGALNAYFAQLDQDLRKVGR